MPKTSHTSSAVSTARGASYLWLQSVTSSVARVIAFALFARLITVEQMGVYTILSLAYSGAITFVGLGMSSIVTKFVAENMAKGDKATAASVYYKALLLSETATVLLAASFLLSKFPAGVSGVRNSPEVSLISILFAIDVVANLGPPSGAAFLGLLEFKDYAVINGLYASLRPFLVILLVYEVKSLVGLVEAWVISDAVSAVYVLFYLWRRLGPPVFRFNTKYLLTLSSPLYISNVASFLYSTFDQLTLIPLVSLAALGIYGAAVNAFSAYYGLISVLGSVLLPVFSRLHGVKGVEAVKNSVHTASRYISMTSIPMAFALVVTARPALTLLVGARYEGGALPLSILALASTSSILAIALSPILIVLNETLLAALTSLLPLTLSVGVALISIPALGILGASIARALSMLLSLLLTWYFVRRKIAVRLDYKAISKTMVASGIMALIIEAFQFVYYSRFLLPIYLATGLVVYLLGMRALKAVNAADIDLLRHTLGPRFSRICNLLSRFVVS